MAMGVEAIIYYLVLLDAIGANVVALFFPRAFKSKKGIWKHFPITKGWTIWYLILVIWVGYGLNRLGIIF